MTTSHTIRKRISRRSVLASLAVSGLATRRARAQAPVEREMVLSARGGSLGAIYRTKIIPPFEAKFGCKVTMVVNDSGPALAKVVAEKANPQTDVLWTVEPTHAQGLAQNVFDKLDPERVPNLAKLYDFARPANGIGAGWGVGGTVIGYNAKIFKERNLPPPVTWGDMLTPATRKHVAWLDLSTHQGINTFLMVNRHLGGTDSNVDPIFKFLKANIGDVLPITSPAQVDDLMQQGEAWVASNLDARMSILKSKGFPLEIVFPSDGLPIQSGMLDLVKGAPHPRLANEFINWVISHDMQEIVGREMQIGPTNKDVKLPPEFAANVVYGEERVSRLIPLDYTSISRDIPKWIDRWNRELA